MIPGEVTTPDGEIVFNEGAQRVALEVANTGDRPIQVGSHYHFFETNPALGFDRVQARGRRLDIAAGTAVRFEPGQTRKVRLIPFAGARGGGRRHRRAARGGARPAAVPAAAVDDLGRAGHDRRGAANGGAPPA